MIKKILLIEDDPPTIDLYQEMLKKENFEVENLTWGQQGLDKLKEIKENKKEKPDLVLLDLILPDINGIEILKEAKNDKETRNIPFFVLTNYTDPELEKESWKLGAEKYIVKANYTPSQLVKVIKEWLEKR